MPWQYSFIRISGNLNNGMVTDIDNKNKAIDKLLTLKRHLYGSICTKQVK